MISIYQSLIFDASNAFDVDVLFYSSVADRFPLPQCSILLSAQIFLSAVSSTLPRCPFSIFFASIRPVEKIPKVPVPIEPLGVQSFLYSMGTVGWIWIWTYLASEKPNPKTEVRATICEAGSQWDFSCGGAEVGHPVSRAHFELKLLHVASCGIKSKHFVYLCIYIACFGGKKLTVFELKR